MKVFVWDEVSASVTSRDVPGEWDQALVDAIGADTASSMTTISTMKAADVTHNGSRVLKVTGLFDGRHQFGYYTSDDEQAALEVAESEMRAMLQE